MAKKNARRRTRRQREAIKKKQQARQNQFIAIGAGAILLLVLIFLGTQLLGGDDASVGEGCPTPEEIDARPLAAVPPAGRNGYYPSAPPFCLADGVDYGAVIRTEKGDIEVDLFEEAAPVTVNSFVFLARQGFYDNTVFHRVLEGFMAQAGDPTGSGSGGPGYSFVDETDNGLVFDRPGLLAMANPGIPDSNGSQFFITYGVPDWLNGNHTIFGELEAGGDVLDSLTLRDPQNLAPDAGTGDLILRIDITES